MQIQCEQNNDNNSVSMAGMTKTFMPAKQVDTGSVMFWFSRTDFYITGMNFVFSRIALMCQLTSIPFYLEEVVHVVSENPDQTPYQVALAPAMSFVASFLFSLFIKRTNSGCCT